MAPTLSLPPHATKSAESAPAAEPAAPAAMAMMGGMSSGQSRQHMAFEEFAGKLQAPATLRAAQVSAQQRTGVACMPDPPSILFHCTGPVMALMLQCALLC